jgi:hypothetical protein
MKIMSQQSNIVIQITKWIIFAFCEMEQAHILDSTLFMLENHNIVILHHI